MGNWSSTKSFGFNKEADYTMIIKDDHFMIKECDAIEGTMKPKLFGKHNLMNIVSNSRLGTRHRTWSPCCRA